MIEPQHTLEIGGVTRRLRYRYIDWMKAEQSAGTGIRSNWGIPITTPAQMLPMMLLAGLNHEIPGLNLDKAAELIEFDREDDMFAACIRAIYDYDPNVKKKLIQLAAVAGPQMPDVLMLLELIQLATTSEFGLSPSTTETSANEKPETSPPDSSTL